MEARLKSYKQICTNQAKTEKNQFKKAYVQLQAKRLKKEEIDLYDQVFNS